MTFQPESSPLFVPTRRSGSRRRRAPHTTRSSINADRLGGRTAAANEQSGENTSSRGEFSEPSVVWPDPS